MSSRGDIIAHLWIRKDKPNCPLSGEAQNQATDVVIPAGAQFAVLKIENRTNERGPTHRLVVFPPRDMQPQANTGTGAGAGAGPGTDFDDVPF